MGTLYIVSSPIGNLEDISLRAIKILFNVDAIACEDTREVSKLLNLLTLKIKKGEISVTDLDLSKKPSLISYYDQIESFKAEQIISLLQNDKNVALVSDNGTPVISDPGFKLIASCLRKKIRIVPIPGPSAFLTALTISGLPPNSFLFMGFPPEKQNKRIKLFGELGIFSQNFISVNPTIIFYCSPHKLSAVLDDLQKVFGDIEIVIARELTKIYEETWKGKISDSPRDLKGEIVLLFNPIFKSEK